MSPDGSGPIKSIAKSCHGQFSFSPRCSKLPLLTVNLDRQSLMFCDTGTSSAVGIKFLSHTIALFAALISHVGLKTTTTGLTHGVGTTVFKLHLSVLIHLTYHLSFVIDSMHLSMHLHFLCNWLYLFVNVQF